MRKNHPSFFLLLVLIMLSGACTGSTITPQPALIPTDTTEPRVEILPTDTPAEVDDWSAVQASGILRIGTAADYQPFAFYNNTGQLDGFDVLLARELAKRLGVTPQITDLAFDNLFDALDLKQIDAAIAAISITPERASLFNFSNVYYAGTDGILARQDIAIAQITSPADLAGLRIGVQKATIYEQWAQENLVTPGLIQPSELFLYETPEGAVSNLKSRQLDIAIMDLVPAMEFTQDGVKLVGQGLIPQKFAIALRKGSTLTAKLNRALADAQADGTVGQLAETYLNVNLEPAATSTPVPTSIPVQPTSAPTIVPTPVPSQPTITKFTASPANLQVGQCTNLSWNVQGSAVLVELRRNGVVVWSNAPLIGTYSDCPTSQGTVLYELIASQSGRFVRAQVPVTVGSIVPPGPTYPFVYAFSLNPSEISLGQCSTLFWSSAFGSSTQLYRDGTLLYTGLPDNGSAIDCPPTPGTVTYLLVVANSVGNVQTEAYLAVDD